MDRELFEQMYASRAPWDIGRPQPSIERLAAAGQISGSVLDAGCGTGDNAIFLASGGRPVLGLDYVAAAIERARAKAAERGVAVEFIVGNALELATLKRQFDTVIDCGLFHTFDDQERLRFVAGLAAVTRPDGRLHILCFSDAEPPSEGPRRVSQSEIRAAFAHGWTIERIEATTFTTTEAAQAVFSPGGPKAWLATMARTA